MKYLIGPLALAIAVVWGVSNIFPNAPGYSSVMKSLKIEPVPAQIVSATPAYHRGMTEKQDQACRPDFNRDHYSSEQITKSETYDNLIKVGFSPAQADVWSAISRAESGSQINCHGDDYAPYLNQRVINSQGQWTGEHWLYSYGLYQIRTIKEHSGKGDCRDIERLRQGIEQQSLCAWEISGGGQNMGPWSVTHKNRGYPYREWLGKNW